MMCACVLLVGMSVALTGCNRNDNGGNGMPTLDAGIVTQIKQDAVALYVQDVPETTVENIFLFYYGTFNDSVVVMIHNAKAFYMRPVWYDIFEIQYSNSNFIRVWNNGNFYRLAEAQTNGFLTASDLEQIAQIHNNKWSSFGPGNDDWV